MVNESGRSRLKFSHQFLLILVLLMGAAFLPVTVVLVVGMLPSVVSLLTDRTRDKTRTLTVALLNFSSCYPLLLEVVLGAANLENASAILSEPLNLCIMFAGAAAGYFLDWTMTGISNVIMTERARGRQEEIKRRQADLERRWGREVTGTIPLDAEGFPLIDEDERK